MRKFGITAALGASALVAVVVLLVGVAPQFSGAADHLDTPAVGADGRTDINDVYAFTNGSNTVLIMTVNPLAGVLSPTTFSPTADYELKIDNDGDAVEDITYRFEFSQPSPNSAAPSQTVTLSRDTGAGFKVIAEGKVSAPSKGASAALNVIRVKGGGKLFAGLRDDPFFFDLASLAGLDFCAPTDPADDFFAGLNVTAIVLEVRTAQLLGATSSIGVWATTADAAGQIDRMGRPVINTVLIPALSKDAFNAAAPAGDAAFDLAVEASLVTLSGLDGSGYSAAEADAIAAILLPDILTFDTGTAAGFLNGRTPADDVIDTSLFVVTGGLGVDNAPAGTAVLDGDCVDANDVPFLSTFPYLAPSH